MIGRKFPQANSAQLSLFVDVPATEAAAGVVLIPKNAGTVAGVDAAQGQPASTVFLHPRASRELCLGDQRVAYELRRGRRRTIGFVVSIDGLTIAAPRRVAQRDIDAALRENSSWILRKLIEQEQCTRRMRAARIDWRDGATFPFLGETVIVVLDARVSGAMLQTDTNTLPGLPRQTLRVGLTHTASAEQIRDAVQTWLRRQALRVFEERCQHYANRLGVHVKRLSLSSARTLWGSANVDGAVRLNWRLVHFSMAAVDYVVAHELAHLRHMDHSPKFWNLVRSVVPDFERARSMLKEEVLS